MAEIRRCCTYTMQKFCPICGKITKIAKPIKFSPPDRYGKYRRSLKVAR